MYREVRRPVSTADLRSRPEPATDDDRPDVLELLAASLGWDLASGLADYFDWKHLANPFGRSPAWVALDGERIVGFRTFLRWEFEDPDGQRAARGAGGRHRDPSGISGTRHLPAAHAGRGRRR